jgi:hypothetical protein
VNRAEFDAQATAVIRRNYRHMDDLGGQPPAALLDGLYGIAIEHAQDGDRERELAEDLTRRNRAFDILARDHNQLVDELIAGLATTEHEKIAVAGLPVCKCGYSLAGGTAPETFVRHVLAVITDGRAELAAKESAAMALAATPPDLDFTPGATPKEALAREVKTPAPRRATTRRSTPK